MDTETRLSSLDERLTKLENLVAVYTDRAQSLVAKLERNPMFAPIIRMIRE